MKQWITHIGLQIMNCMAKIILNLFLQPQNLKLKPKKN